MEVKMWNAWVNFILGLWLLLSGFVQGFVVPGNFIIVGIVVAFMGFTGARKWQGVVNGILGLWLILSGLLPGLIAGANMGITGAVIAVLALWRAISK